jgi:hypothetical protein
MTGFNYAVATYRDRSFRSRSRCHRPRRPACSGIRLLSHGGRLDERPNETTNRRSSYPLAAVEGTNLCTSWPLALSCRNIARRFRLFCRASARYSALDWRWRSARALYSCRSAGSRRCAPFRERDRRIDLDGFNGDSAKAWSAAIPICTLRQP